jgi:hypothetical protein
VISIFSTDRSQQFVRVERDYMPEGFNALEYTADNSIAAATVLLKAGNVTYQLRDTTIPREDTSRYKMPIRGYVLEPFTPTYGKSYEVRVQTAEFGLTTGSVTVPYKPQISLDPASYYVLDYPTKSQTDAEILFPLIIGAGAKGFIGRLIVSYDVLKDGEWVEEKGEIPVVYTYAGLRDFRYVTYGHLTACPVNNRTAGLYSNDLYSKTLAGISDKNGSTKVVFKWIVFQLLQLDPHLYGYYYVSHAYDDPHSIRLDEPMYSSVTGGLGFVGAYTLDSLVHLLPENFAFNRR